MRTSESLKLFASSLNLILREGRNPQAAFDDTLNWLELVLCAGIDQAEQALDDARSSAVTFKVDQHSTLTAFDLRGLLGIVGEVMHV
jgi:hypothetical protein